MKSYPDLPADANVEAWLVTIAHRKAIDVTRAAARRAIPVAETPDTATSPAAGDAVLDAAAELTQALAKLPAKQKQAIAYHYLAGLPYAEVAAIFGGSADAARRAAADGIAALRRSYPGPGTEGAPGEPDKRSRDLTRAPREPDREPAAAGWPPRPTRTASWTSPTHLDSPGPAATGRA